MKYIFIMLIFGGGGGNIAFLKTTFPQPKTFGFHTCVSSAYFQSYPCLAFLRNEFETAWRLRATQLAMKKT